MKRILFLFRSVLRDDLMQKNISGSSERHFRLD